MTTSPLRAHLVGGPYDGTVIDIDGEPTPALRYEGALYHYEGARDGVLVYTAWMP